MKNIYVEGNIGTGKTTFIKYLEQHLPSDKYNFVYEPVDEWMKTTDNSGKSILSISMKTNQNGHIVFS